MTEKIIGAAIKVHSALGNGFQEVIYQRALYIEMESQGISCAREIEQPIFYREIEIGARRADFVVEDKVLVEIKAITMLNDVHFAQILNYLTAYKFEVGLLVNFGEKRLTWKRVVKTIPPPSLSASSQNPN